MDTDAKTSGSTQLGGMTASARTTGRLTNSNYVREIPRRYQAVPFVRLGLGSDRLLGDQDVWRVTGGRSCP